MRAISPHVPVRVRDYIFVRWWKEKRHGSAALHNLATFGRACANDGAFFWLIGTLVLAAGCSTAPMHPVNLKEPGWTLREGQAVWKRNRNATEIAGEVLVANR